MIAEKLQKQVLEELHKDHPGIVHMKAIVRSYIRWEGVDKDIESIVKSCQACQSVKNSPPNAMLHPWLYPTKPWQCLYVDFAGLFRGRMYLQFLMPIQNGHKSTRCQVLQQVGQ